MSNQQAGGAKLRRMSVPQPVRLLCADDIVRDPSTGRLARIVKHVEDSTGVAFFAAIDFETGEAVGLALRKSARFVVYID